MLGCALQGVFQLGYKYDYLRLCFPRSIVVVVTASLDGECVWQEVVLCEHVHKFVLEFVCFLQGALKAETR